MKAFYFCDKSKQILSDKDSGEFKKNFESAYPNPFMKDINEDNTLGSTLQFNNLEEGYYYCIVVNTLNNHRVANVTPFYYIH